MLRPSRRPAADGDPADDLIAGLDRHPTARGHQLGVVERGIERPRRRDCLGQFSGRDSSYGRRIGFAASEVAPQHSRPVAGKKHLESADAVHDRDRSRLIQSD